MMADAAREEMLNRVRSALQRRAGSPVPPVPETARVAERPPAEPDAELELFLAEAGKLGVKTKCLRDRAELATALRDLARDESIQKATVWQTHRLREWGVEEVLRSLGVEIVSPYEPNRRVADCELGVTSADFALPETGTLVMRSSAEQPRTVSLLPRVHLAIIRPAILRADLHPVLDAAKHDDYFVFITGPSRTSDIELTTTIGVHGPKTLHVWVLPD